MKTNINFSLNHIISPKLDIIDFFKLAKNLNIHNIEIRNDIEKTNLSGLNLDLVNNYLIEYELNIISINALQKFNLWNSDRKKELIFLCELAKKVKCEGIVLVPLNTGEFIDEIDRRKIMSHSLKEISPILSYYNINGYIEPLGFKSSSIRLKKEVLEELEQIESQHKFSLVHDTFHHYLSNENEIFTEKTGLVHISGVIDKSLKIEDIKDDNRELIDQYDILDNIGQIKILINNQYKGFFSFEPFSKKIHNLINPSKNISSSLKYISSKF